MRCILYALPQLKLIICFVYRKCIRSKHDPSFNCKVAGDWYVHDFFWLQNESVSNGLLGPRLTITVGDFRWVDFRGGSHPSLETDSEFAPENQWLEDEFS